ncbi:TIGR03752 family integrating conjugative element protein [Gilliamella sp. Nev3-1]|uniref:TIGR03752 family integrating conjugative element protein n=1 Tax=Gilliamella sp. Nev3-1 TaxID=3120250 RepID=UPI00080E08F5|nr:TIGR03752 family integrating conjugative element protein [Gilliamella apicola]OCG57899.1 integrating conjugative element protein [Gilliamella apicola]
MATIKGNKLLPLIVGGVILVGIFIVVIANKNKKNESSSSDEIVEIADLNEEDLSVLGITGDTEKDTVQTLVTLVKTLKKDQADIVSELKKLKSENENLKKTRVPQYKIEPPSNDSKSNEPTELEKKVSILTDKLNKLASNSPISSSSETPDLKQSKPVSIPIGRGQTSSKVDMANDDEIQWINPADQIVSSNKGKNTTGFQFPTSFGSDPIRSKLKDHKESINQPIGERKNEKDRQPFYTVPANSTLTGSVSMTSLLGRVPIDGVVSDPYPFKAVIGRDNLISNGIELPHIEGAIVSGTASGDYVLSCVRGNVKSITFVFDDGRIITIPDSSKNSKDESIGWLSDEYGIPCVSGEIKSNASQYLSTVIGLGTAAAAADAMAQQNTTVVTDGSNVTNAVTGNNGQYVLGKGLSGGINQTIDWLNKRYGQTFDAVYVPPGKEIAIHISKELQIDYLFDGRFVDYEMNIKKMGGLD